MTAPERSTNFAIGEDLAKFVAPAANIELKVLPSDGSAANIKHLRYDPGVTLAIVQADVYQAFLDRAAAGNAEASAMMRRLRVILPLYNTEIHFIVRADSPMSYIHDIKNAKINPVAEKRPVSLPEKMAPVISLSRRYIATKHRQA